MNATPRRQNDLDHDRLGARLRADAERASREAPAGIRERVIRQAMATQQPPRRHFAPTWRASLWGAAGLAAAASITLLISASLVQPVSTTPAQPAPEVTDDRTAFDLFRDFRESASRTPHVMNVVLAAEFDHLKQDAGRVTEPIRAAWAPVKAILSTQ